MVYEFSGTMEGHELILDLTLIITINIFTITM